MALSQDIHFSHFKVDKICGCVWWKRLLIINGFLITNTIEWLFLDSEGGVCLGCSVFFWFISTFCHLHFILIEKLVLQFLSQSITKFQRFVHKVFTVSKSDAQQFVNLVSTHRDSNRSCSILVSLDPIPTGWANRVSSFLYREENRFDFVPSTRFDLCTILKWKICWTMILNK